MLRMGHLVGAAFAVVVPVSTALAQAPAFVENGVVCLIDGTLRHTGEGGAVSEDYNPVKPLRGEHDPFTPRPRPSTATGIDLRIGDCRWLAGEELEPCLPAEGGIDLLVTGSTVTETQCGLRTFAGTFHREGDESACSGDFQCGHAAIEIAVDVAKQVDRGQLVIEDPGSVEAEPNNGRGENPPLVETCTFELRTTIDGTPSPRRFGLVTMNLLGDPASLAAFHAACSAPPGPGEEPAVAEFTGTLGSSVGF